MTHAHDRTMLARLGFADPDKRNSLHDDLCAYLATDATSIEVVRVVGRKLGTYAAQRCAFEAWSRDRAVEEQLKSNPNLTCVDKGDSFNSASYRCRHSFGSEEFTNPKATLEDPLTKGEGKYSTTLGFLDVVYRGFQFRGTCPVHGSASLLAPFGPEPRWSRPGPHLPSSLGGRIVLEVKAGRVSPNEVLRQIKFYQAHTKADAWVVFTGFKYGADDIALLEREGVLVFSAGPKFAAWQRARQEAPATNGEEI